MAALPPLKAVPFLVGSLAALVFLPSPARSQVYGSSYKVFDVPGYPAFLVPADFDGDGMLDLAVSNASGDAALLAGTGHGLEASRPLSLGDVPAGLAAADLNRDGHPDLVAGNYNERRVSTWLGRGDGSFDFADSVSTEIPALLVDTGDFNGDGFTDVVATRGDTSVVEFIEGQDRGTLLPPVSVEFPFLVRAMSAMPSNGTSAILAAGWNDSVTFVAQLPGSVEGFEPLRIVYSEPMGYSAGPIIDARAGDLNADGLPDIVFVQRGPYRIGVLLGLPSGGMSEADFLPTPDDVRFALVADATGDGQADIVATEVDVDRVMIFPGDGHGGFDSPSSFSSGSVYSVAVHDFTGDGLPDIAVAQGSVGSVALLEGAGNGRFGHELEYRFNRDHGGVVVADWNGDGRLDFVVGTIFYPGGGELRFYPGGGDGTFGDPKETAVGVEVNALAAGDLTGDGKADVVVVTKNGPALQIFAGAGDGTFTRAGVVRGPTEADRVAVGDLNGDGRLDVAVTSSRVDSLQLYLNSGDGRMVPGSSYHTGDQPFAVVMARVDDDPFPDVVVPNRTRGGVSIFPGRGDGTLSAERPLSTWAKPVDVGVADMNGDCLPDVVVGFEESRRFSVFTNRGNWRFSDPVDHVGTKFNWNLTVSDLDHDGRPEVLTGNPWHGVISIHRQTNEPGLFDDAELGTGSHPVQIRTGDFNGDGYEDLLVVKEDDFLRFTLGVLESNGPIIAIRPVRPLDIVSVWPNPTTLGAAIQLDGTLGAGWRCDLFDLRGGLVRRLSTAEPGSTMGPCLVWDGRDESGMKCPSGQYFVRVVNGSQKKTARIVVVR